MVQKHSKNVSVLQLNPWRSPLCYAHSEPFSGESGAVHRETTGFCEKEEGREAPELIFPITV